MDKKEKEHEQDEEAKILPEEQRKKENKQLKSILIGIGIIFLAFIFFIFFTNALANFKYKGVEFKVIKDNGLIFYNTAFPIYSPTGEHTADYNFYLRNDPRKLKDIPFNGNYTLMENMVINITGEFNCDGDGVIAVANLVKVHEFFGTKVIRDENATCDELGRYTFVRITEGNETKIEQFGPACYNIYVKDCEILPATERFIIEVFVIAHGITEK